MATANDLTIYERHAEDWWNTRSAAFRSLHSVNAFRVALLREWLGEDLRDRVVADLGCGGGRQGVEQTLRPVETAGRAWP